MPVTAFPQSTGTLLLQGGAGLIDAVIEWPTGSIQRDAVAVICLPHPLHGGTMTNKVVTTTAHALRDLGCTTLRFNFRGVGRSQGEHDDGRGEGDDVVSICGWIRQARPGVTLILAGFSFGAFVSMTRAAEIHPQQLISIAPPVGRWNLSEFREPDCRWLVLQPDADEVVDPSGVYDWVAQRRPPPTVVRFAETSHFFHGRLLALREAIAQFVEAGLPPLA